MIRACEPFLALPNQPLAQPNLQQLSSMSWIPSGDRHEPQYFLPVMSARSLPQTTLRSSPSFAPSSGSHIERSQSSPLVPPRPPISIPAPPLPDSTRMWLRQAVRAELASFPLGRSRSCGIVGMPNVGKSTLFNALTNTQAAQAANYPFCTIDPNVGKVSIPDLRLEKLAKVAKSAKIIGAQLEFVDIAGLVKGASEGAGLGNKFLSHIRQVSMIVQLVRCFDDNSREIITHVDGSVDPVRDIETIETELLLADIQTLSRKDGNAKKSATEQELASRILKDLDNGIPARKFILQPEEVPLFRNFSLLTGKPMLIVCNVPDTQLSGNKYTEAVQHMLHKRRNEDPEYPGEQGEVINVCSKLEEEVSLMDDEESRVQMLQEYGLEKTGLSKIVEESNRRLGLKTYYTVGPQEARAWQFPDGMLAPQASGIIHTDFEKGFIKAETISYDDYVACGGEQGAKEAGKLRLEGKEYNCQDGDIFHFKFNV